MWLKLPSTALVHGHKGLGLQLPAELIPQRWAIELSVQKAKLGGYFLDVKHLHPYEKARRGQYAWQANTPYNRHDHSAYIASRPFIHALVPDSALSASPFDWHPLKAALGRDPEIYVQPYAKGFRFWINPPHTPRHVVNRVPRWWIDKLQTDLFHGGHSSLQNHPGWTREEPEISTCLYLNTNTLITTNEEGNTDMRKNMTDTTTSNDLPFGLIAGEKIVECEFTDGGQRRYAYFAGSLEVEVGDYVVVASPYGDGVFDEESGGHLTVVRVTSMDLNPEGIRKAAKWIISKVDVSAYRERRAKIEQLRTLDEQIKLAEREARAKLEMEKLRELSPELAALIDARMALTA